MKKIIKINLIAGIFAAMLLSITGCEEELYVREVVDGVPVISSFSPSEGLNQTLVTVKGSYLKNIDSASFGGGEAVIYRIINDAEVVLKVTNASASGKIYLQNSLGSTQSATDFNMNYFDPVAEEWPTQGEINQNVTITGTDLLCVTNVYFTSLSSPDPSEAKIVYQSNDELAVQVPYVDAHWSVLDDTRATISLTYNSAEGSKTITGPQYTFKAIKPPFEVLNWPTAVLKNSEVNILGTNINLADSVYFGDQPATIIKSTPISITVQVPDFSERSFVNMHVVYFRNLEIVNDVQTEVYTKYRKTIGNFEGGISSMILRTDRIAPGVNYSLEQSSDSPLLAPEGNYYASYYTDPDPVNKSSVPVYFAYNEGDGNTINLNAFEDPVLHFYYFNDSTPAYLQLEILMGGAKMRLYIERYRTSKEHWELVCIRLKEAEFGTGYDGPFNTIPYKDAYEQLNINFKPDEDDTIQIHIDNIFISEGAISGAIDLTKHTKENGNIISVVE